MIRFENVTFSRGGHTVLKEVSFFIGSNETVAVLGSSGEGKTTLLRLILRLLHPDSGRIFIDDLDITDLPEEKLAPVRKKFSIVFQDGALFDSLTVRENVAFYFREFTNYTENEIEKHVRELLGFVGVEEAIDLMPEELSGGMQRRVAIARALATRESKMFLYDEPTSDLDPLSADKICSLIKDLDGRERGFIVVTHAIPDALRLARRFMFLKNGSILFDGTKEQMLNADIPELRLFLSYWREIH